MTRAHVLVYALTLACIPVVAALLTGQDPMVSYAHLAGMLMRAAEIGLEMRR